MKHVKLSRQERKVLRYLDMGYQHCPRGYSERKFAAGVYGLEQHGLADTARDSFGDLVAVKLSEKGAAYLVQNPRITNPINWANIITACCAIIGAIGTVLTIIFNVL